MTSTEPGVSLFQYSQIESDYGLGENLACLRVMRGAVEGKPDQRTAAEGRNTIRGKGKRGRKKHQQGLISRILREKQRVTFTFHSHISSNTHI